MRKQSLVRIHQKNELVKLLKLKTILNYNRLNLNLSFENFIKGKANIAIIYSKKC